MGVQEVFGWRERVFRPCPGQPRHSNVPSMAPKLFVLHFASFMTSCDCGLAYVVETALDGAHSKAAGSPPQISDLYQALSGDEYSIADENGLFFYKRDPDSRAERNSD